MINKKGSYYDEIEKDRKRNNVNDFFMVILLVLIIVVSFIAIYVFVF